MRINLSALFILFLILKVTGVIAWSWLWITAPLWIPIILGLSIFVGALIVGLIVAIAGSFYLKKISVLFTDFMM